MSGDNSFLNLEEYLEDQYYPWGSVCKPIDKLCVT